MSRFTILILLLLISINGNTGGNTIVKGFDRVTLDIEDNWTSNEVGYKDSELISFFRKNIGASELSGHPELENLVYLTVTYTPANVQGFPSDQDYKYISDFEDNDIPKIESESNSIHIASVLKNGIYDFLFYVSDPDKFLQSYSNNKTIINSFQVDLELANDPKWEIYHDLP